MIHLGDAVVSPCAHYAIADTRFACRDRARMGIRIGAAIFVLALLGGYIAWQQRVDLEVSYREQLSQMAGSRAASVCTWPPLNELPNRAMRAGSMSGCARAATIAASQSCN